MNPKHIDEVPTDRRAIAPYNFVELPEKIIPSEPIPTHNCYHENRHTGKIECILTTSSPLYIRCGMSSTDFTKFGGKSDEDVTNDDERSEKRKILASFFQNPANQYPTIPGSSLRGMLRTLVEIVSYSKIDKVADKQLIYRAFADTTSLGEFYRDRLLQEEGERQYSLYKNSIGNFIPEPNYKFIPDYPYNSPTLDITEALFGFARDTKHKENQTQAGRVFISDARCQKSAAEDIWLKGDITKSITPKILATPKPTTFQHYLVQNSAVESELRCYANQSDNKTVLRGHKLYWHKGSVEQSQIEEGNTNKIKNARSQYTDIKPIKKDVSFEFTIWFENLSEVELGALLWVLKLAADKNYRLSLGMGKPLGMGAIQITSQLSLSNRQSRYHNLFQGMDWATGNNFDIDPNRVQISCLQEFEDYVLKHTDATINNLHDVLRIKNLLTMLQWEGVADNSSRYMEIERKQQPCIGELRNNGKTNEYKHRPVLPTPSQVVKDDRKQNYPGSSSTSYGGGSNPAAWQRPK
jgi:CRISPR/Cas system CSM-associated protein Csm3 (group 7 of RAMP superfamily)